MKDKPFIKRALYFKMLKCICGTNPCVFSVDFFPVTQN